MSSRRIIKSKYDIFVCFVVPPAGLEPGIFASKAVMISPPASPVPPERFELPTTGSKPVVISISPWGLGTAGRHFTTEAGFFNNT